MAQLLRGLQKHPGIKLLHSPSPTAVSKECLSPSSLSPLSRCCFTIRITLFTVSCPPLTVWNSRLCVAKFLSGQYTLSASAANCLHLSPALRTATGLNWLRGLSSGTLPLSVRHCHDSLSLSHLERTKQPAGCTRAVTLVTVVFSLSPEY